MGKIIGEGITFDDVLLVPAYSEVIPNQVDTINISDKEDEIKYSDDECRNGYCYRTSYGDCHGETGWYWYHSQKHDNRSTGRGSR